ncbi:16S rRNA (guanine(966)-N(2))-methyltransferase RsmD [Bacillota bacterium LX-D]|nr:16S rRNA (guanine(966)-N(2))-methyltransferase RsmD [Bacillota bacterium LX-D]
MRIISGKAKGHPIVAPKGFDTRPTTDRVREAIFNIIQMHISGAEVLDLFAGTGALGIEALSRGAKKAFFVEKSLPALKCIEKNLLTTKLKDFAYILNSDAFFYLTNCKEKFDLIFLDPPYGHNLVERALEIISQRSILNSKAIIIAETSKSDNLPVSLKNIECYRQVRYGDTMIWFYYLAKGEEE